MTERNIDMRAKKIMELDVQIKELKEQQDKLKAEIQEVMGDEEVLTTKRYIINWPHFCKQIFDAKGFKEIHPDLYNIFAKDNEQRRFSVKEA